MKKALVSVFDKTDIVELCLFLINNDYTIYSTGGTYDKLVEIKSDKIKNITELTNYPEILNGRVKTLHPQIFGGILAKDKSHLVPYNISKIDLVIVNLYPFETTIKTETNEDVILDNIDIGGHSLIRACIKNYKNTLVIVDPIDYKFIMNNNNIDNKEFAKRAMKYIANYDIAISQYFNPDMVYKQYIKEIPLKYGLNPQQKIAGLYRNTLTSNIPFKVLNGNPGYINILDAIYGWNLVTELKDLTNMSACASYKHNSPAGVGLCVPLNETLKKAYFVKSELSTVGVAYIRARNADPLSSFGDFMACNDIIDTCTAKLIANDISDGIIAPGYNHQALEILKKKKKELL